MSSVKDFDELRGVIIESAPKELIFRFVFDISVTASAVNAIKVLFMTFGAKPVPQHSVSIKFTEPEINQNGIPRWELRKAITGNLFRIFAQRSLLHQLLEWIPSPKWPEMLLVRKGQLERLKKSNISIVKVRAKANKIASLLYQLTAAADSYGLEVFCCRMNRYFDHVIAFSFTAIDSNHVELQLHVDEPNPDSSNAPHDAIGIEIVHIIGARLFEQIHYKPVEKNQTFSKVVLRHGIQKEPQKETLISEPKEFYDIVNEEWGQHEMQKGAWFHISNVDAEAEQPTSSPFIKFGYATFSKSLAPMVIVRAYELFFYRNTSEWRHQVQSVFIKPEGSIEAKLPYETNPDETYELMIVFKYDNNGNGDLNLKRLVADFMCASCSALRIADGLIKMQDGSVPVLVPEKDGYYIQRYNSISRAISFKVGEPEQTEIPPVEFSVFSTVYEESIFVNLGPLTSVLYVFVFNTVDLNF